MSVAVNISEDFQNYLQGNKSSQGLGSVLQVKNNLKQLSSKFSFSASKSAQDSQQERLLSDEPISEKDDAESSNFFFWKSQETQSKESFCPSLSRLQRFTGFVTCLFLAIFCFGSATFYIPLLVLRARKFVALYTLGCVFLLSSLVFLKGPATFVSYVFSRERLLFTSCYGGSLAATVYFSLFLQSTILTVLAAIFQFAVLIWFLISYIPGGSTGLSFMTRAFSRSLGLQSLPI